MKIKTKQMDYAKVLELPRPSRLSPKKPSILFRSIVRAAAEKDLKDVHFSFSQKDMERAGCGPWLILMNHSSFVDLEIVSKIMFPKPYCIVCTSDGFVGKPWLMQHIGCIPTQKFVSDVGLIRDISYTLKTLKTSVLMYPEASYSFDGSATPLPRRLGVLLKRLGVSVVMIRTFGAFSRDPLYNCLQKRNVDVSAEMSCLISADELKEKSVAELDDILDKAFTFDHFRWQQENEIKIPEEFRADGLNRILYKCCDCEQEGFMEAKGTKIHCAKCGSEYELDEFGNLKSLSGKGRFNHIPDWYKWEREEVRKQLEEGSYLLESDVTIGMMVDFKYIYMVGDGHLKQDTNGFELKGCNGQLEYFRSPLTCYSLYSDYYWYEIGDVICLGGGDALYYCFPKEKDIVAKARLAAEESYKLAVAAKKK